MKIYFYRYRLVRTTLPGFSDPRLSDEYEVRLIFKEGYDESSIVDFKILNAPPGVVSFSSVNTFKVKANYRDPITIRVQQLVDHPIISGARAQIKEFLGMKYSFIYNVESFQKEETPSTAPILITDPAKEKREETKRKTGRFILFFIFGLLFIVLATYVFMFIRKKKIALPFLPKKA
ncbi:MAG: hypothetical protein RMJ67_01205 [Elusimicrobiota bacterium]|nr:hypothetical protein [Endomicrobiia bacterium]MDW8165121.1 hypothetical protein [Elusimicrobiota bacterium]